MPVKKKLSIFPALITVLVICLLTYQFHDQLLGALITERKGTTNLAHAVDKFPLGAKKINSFDTTVDAKGRIHLAVDDGSARYYLWSDDGGALWANPVHVSDGPSSSIPGNDVRFAVKDLRQVIVWKDKGEFPGWGRAQVAISNDAGLHWQPGENPVEKDSNFNQGYFSLLADQNNFHLLWLDDRKESGQDQQLRYSKSSNGLDWQEDTLVDNSVCTCCWLSAQNFEGKVFTLYRGTTPRDMQIASFETGSKNWKMMARVGEFDWDFTGCPHQGGDLAVSEHNTTTIFHSVVFTGRSEMLGLHYFTSKNQGESWQYRHPIGNTSARYVDIATLDGQAFIAWQELFEQQYYIKILQINPEGDASAHYQKQVPGNAYPRIVTHDNTLKLFWLEKDQSNLQSLQMTTIPTDTSSTSSSGIIL